MMHYLMLRFFHLALFNVYLMLHYLRIYYFYVALVNVAPFNFVLF